MARIGSQSLTKIAQHTAFFTTPMGKTALPEDHPLFSGCYIGSISQPEVRDHIESSDLVFCVGSLKSDFNTGSFSYKIPEEKTVELHSYHTSTRIKGDALAKTGATDVSDFTQRWPLPFTPT